MSDDRTAKSPMAAVAARAQAALGAFKNLGRPAKILIVTTLVAIVGLAAWLGQRATSVTYAPLYASLPSEEASTVAAKLKELKVPYRVVEGGRVEVPEERVPELRLEMAGAGLPRGGAVGFEMFDKSRLGATEFEQKLLYRRALEGEIVRTVGTMASVENVRVHLVMPERSVFATRREPGSASVVVKIRPGHDLGPPEVAAIVHLVASAVPGLLAGQVAVATTDGKLLRKPRSDDDASGGGSGDDDDAGEVKAMETSLESRARAILERVVGPGHADVKVNVQMDFARIERQTDTFEPATRALRSEELTVEKAATADSDVAGVPGAESNLPGEEPATDVPAEEGAGVVRHQHTRNFEVSRVSEKRISRSGRVQRIAVAVLLDGVPGDDGAVVPRDPEQIEQLAALVRTAVGASDERQDLVTVESMPFAIGVVEEEAPAPVAPPSPLDALPQGVRRVLPFAAGGVLLLVVLGAVLIVRRRRKARAAKADALALRASTELEAPLGADGLPSAREEALRIAAEDPATAALIMREWLGAAAPAETARAA